MNVVKKIWVCLAICIIFIGCNPRHFSHSDMFQQIMRDSEKSTFRGTTLGEDIHLVIEREKPNTPTHEDILGIRYQIDLGGERKMIITYYKDNVQTETESNRVASIIADIYLKEDLETAQLYNELQAYFIEDNTYGLASGIYGNFIWESRLKKGMEVILKLDENRNIITLNFIDTQPLE